MENTGSDRDDGGWYDFAADTKILPLQAVGPEDTVALSLTWDEWPPSNNDYDLYLCRVGNEILLIHYGLGVSHPSPFNSQVFNPLEISEPASVKIRLLNISGQQITSLFKEMAAPGKH